MKVQILSNANSELQSLLTTSIQQSRDIKLAVAFVTRGGLSLVSKPLNTAISAGASVEFLIGMDLEVTEPAALQQLYELTARHEKVALYCFSDLQSRRVYHPKLYFFFAPEIVTLMVGSSNLTGGGLKRNIELNVVLQGSDIDEPINEALLFYNQLKFLPERVIPDAEYINLYMKLWERRKASRKASARDPELKNSLADFKDKAASLQRPSITPLKSSGWTRLVWEVLPDSEFTNKDIYTFEEEFRRRYPGNTRIRAKIRQRLQVLHQMGLIEHPEAGRWVKKP